MGLQTRPAPFMSGRDWSPILRTDAKLREIFKVSRICFRRAARIKNPDAGDFQSQQ